MPSRRSLLRAFLAKAPPPPPPARADTLVVVFLRGGADGLNMVVPHFELAYRGLRPNLALAEEDTLELDGKFRLHPALEPLLPLYRSKQLAIVHAAGSDDETRSHFEAQDLMEHGGRHDQGAAGGWIARHLRAAGLERGSPLASIAIDTAVPRSLAGAPAVALTSLDELALAGHDANREALEASLDALYQSAEGGVADTGRNTLAMLRRVAAMLETDGKAVAEPAAPPAEAAPALSDFERGLGTVARLIRADVGLRAATIDVDGWDTHFVQGTTGGLQADRMRVLAAGLAGFVEQLGDRIERTVVLVGTEFGRRAYENSSPGTDHGRGSIMFALGAGVAGGRIITDWPGLARDALEGPGDLPVSIDHRDVAGEIVTRVLGNEHVDEVFPGYTPTWRGVTS